MPIENTIEEKNGKIEITVPLEEQYELKYENLKLCTPTEKKTDLFFKRIDAGVFGASSMCNNGNCTVTIGLENNEDYPKSIFAYVKEGVLCQKKRISTTTKPMISQYEALIDMTAKLLKLLAVEGNAYNISVSKTQSSNTWQLMGTKKVAFYYQEPLASDILMIDGVEKAKLVYLYKNTNKVVQAPKSVSESKAPKAPKAPKLTLEEKKDSLELELKKLQEEELKALKEEQKALLEELKLLKG
jgi:hypothetical protein